MMANSAHEKKDLIGLDRQALLEEMTALGEKPFRVKQLWHWLYQRGATDFSSMTSLGKPLREKLQQNYHVSRPGITENHLSSDGTRKWLLNFPDRMEVEAVYIPEDDHGALCMSSQVGCTLNCSFCHTGTQKRVRDLTAAEILGQFLLARDEFGEWPTPQGEIRKLSNIVMMGMGEPLLNYDNVATALKIIKDHEGIALSRRRITLSTSGIVPMMKRCGEELGVNLAVSLHAARDDLRDELVPINRKYPLKTLMHACREYPGAHNARRITFEYVMLKGINDSLADVRALLRLVKGVPAKFNLIPFNPWPGVAYQCSNAKTMKRFADALNDGGYSAPIRSPRGRDIMAACGQLKSASEHRRLQQKAPYQKA